MRPEDQGCGSRRLAPRYSSRLSRKAYQPPASARREIAGVKRSIAVRNVIRTPLNVAARERAKRISEDVKE